MSLDEFDLTRHFFGERLAAWLRRADRAVLRKFRNDCVVFVVESLSRTRPDADSLVILRSVLRGAEVLPADVRLQLLGILAEAEQKAFKRVSEHPSFNRPHDGPLNAEELEWWAVRAVRGLLDSDVRRGAEIAASAVSLATNSATVIRIAQESDKDV